MMVLFFPPSQISADNFLAIEQQPDGTFKAYDRNVEGDYKPGEGFFAFAAKDEKEAIIAAQKYSSEEIVEYGTKFVFLPKP